MKYEYEVIAFYRKQLGLSQEECAKSANVLQQQWDRWERGVSIPSAVNLVKIINSLHLDNMNCLFRWGE